MWKPRPLLQVALVGMNDLLVQLFSSGSSYLKNCLTLGRIDFQSERCELVYQNLELSAVCTASGLYRIQLRCLSSANNENSGWTRSCRVSWKNSRHSRPVKTDQMMGDSTEPCRTPLVALSLAFIARYCRLYTVPSSHCMRALCRGMGAPVREMEVCSNGHGAVSNAWLVSSDTCMAATNSCCTSPALILCMLYVCDLRRSRAVRQ